MGHYSKPLPVSWAPGEPDPPVDPVSGLVGVPEGTLVTASNPWVKQRWSLAVAWHPEALEAKGALWTTPFGVSLFRAPHG